jgi:hypothetical protein
MNQIKSLIITGLAQLCEQLRHLPTLKLIAACARLRPGHQLGDTEHAPRPRCADWLVAINSSLKRSPKPTMSFSQL